MNGPKSLWLCSLVLVACNTGYIGKPGGPENSEGTRSGDGLIQDPSDNAGPLPADDDSSRPAAPSGAIEPAPAALRKLTVEQYENSVHDLLGPDVELPSSLQLEADVAQNGFYAVGASNATISPAAAEKLEQAAYALAAQALSSAHRAGFVPCAPSATSDSACAQKFLKDFGRRAFRRPLEAAELTRYAKIADDSAKALGDFYQGLEFAVAAVLQSPNFLFRVELGEPDPSDARRLRYTSYELATRLSYALWNTTPDAALLAAAESGELGADLGKHAERLLTDPRAARALDNFHSERLGLLELDAINKDSSVGDLRPELRSAMRDDVLRSFAEVSGKPGSDYLNVFDSRVAYVNKPLAELYGQRSDASALTRVELPASAERLGFLGKPAFLALTAHNSQTSPTLRGKYIRERLLCQAIPAPPANVVPVLAEPDPNAPTMRERLKQHANDPACAGCHTLMDPLGLSLEHFDAIGRYRKDDKGHALDTRGDFDGTAFDGAVELSQLLKDDPRTAECVVRQVFRYALGHIEDKGEEPQIEALVSAFEDGGHDLTALFRSLASSDAFRYAGKERP
jgi:hypothetical protein